MLLAWTTFAFGGVYPATLVVPAILCLALLVAYRPWTSRSEGFGAMDAGFALVLLAALAQMLPLPGPVVDLLSPRDRQVWSSLALDVPAALPLSIDLASGAWASAVALGTFAVFLVARQVFATGGVRLVVRGISAIGVAVTAIALAQDATGHGLMYWRWSPLGQGAAPFGPFVNRNHFATWVVLAVPLCVGYQAAHLAAHHHAREDRVQWRRRVLEMFDARAIWLTFAVLLMLVGLATSLSRSGWLGLAVAAVSGAAWRPAGSGAHRARTRTAAAVALLAIAVVAARVDPAALAGRFSSAPGSVADRARIWRETIPIVRDFWLTGTGAGTYETAMLVYQRSDRSFRFNQAHNHYLQFAAEGGLLLGLPFLAGLWHYGRGAAQRLNDDRSGMSIVRAGALSGLLGVAAQSVWETGLTTPANAALAALCAAILIHRPLPRSSPSH